MLLANKYNSESRQFKKNTFWSKTIIIVEKKNESGREFYRDIFKSKKK